MKAMQTRLYHHQEIEFTTDDLQDFPFPNNILLVTPDFFDVVDMRNPYMEGHIGDIDKDRAWQQWNALYAVYLQLKERGWLADVQIVNGQPGLVDMVFAANQSLPWLLPDGQKVVILSRMCNDNRQKEVAFFRPFYEKIGYKELIWPDKVLLEGNGDIIPHPGKRLLWAGYGHRSSMEAAALLPGLLQTPVIPLHLISEHFYHLDTCFLPVDASTVLLCEAAFDAHSLDAIRKVFSNVIAISEEEAISSFALNALVIHHSEKGKVAIIQKGAIQTIQALENAGCEVIEVETGEFMKSGGSVFCMKMMYW
jgi:N-dimethylarginine dimethylaminohydrolase